MRNSGKRVHKLGQISGLIGNRSACPKDQKFQIVMVEKTMNMDFSLFSKDLIILGNLNIQWIKLTNAIKLFPNVLNDL